MKKIALFVSVLALAAFAQMRAQESVSIARIQGTETASPYAGKQIRTEGVVTHTLFGSGQVDGFFLQDTAKGGDDAASKGIFVYGQADVRQGDFITLTATVSEYRQRTQLSGASDLQVLAQGLPVPYTTVKFPEDLSSSADFERFEGMALRIAHPLYLVSTYQLANDAAIELSSKRLRSPTDYNMPGSDAYRLAVDSNRTNRLLLDDGSTNRNPSENPWLDADGTCRTGQITDSLLFVIDQVDDRYRVYAVQKPVFYGNERTAAPDEEALGDYELKVCGFNLEMYFDQEPVQRARLISALSAIDADMFGLVEVGGGRKVIDSLVAALNRSKEGNDYTYLSWSGHEAVSSYTLNHIVYRASKVEPYDQYFMLNNVTPVNRKLIQAFRELKHGQKFIFSINHFKAKSGSGTGADADRGDGQGVYNNQRVQEAYAVQDRLNSLKFYYNTDRVLIMGDLNAMYMEDPIRVFTDNGYRNQTHRFGENYSYCYDGQVQYLDYSLASPEMEECVTGATVWHINSDEPSFWDYDRDQEIHTGPYRCSDHEPVILGLRFTGEPNVANATNTKAGLRLSPNPAKDFVVLESETEGRLQIFNLSGVQVLEKRVNAGSNTLNLHSLPSGVYVLRLVENGGEVRIGKLLLQ
ncbi:MAG: ExeM/NucH family extracellular endonuclease [Bacteroides sp.]|nr:ExeM/NucH family extracellular endonuclease [Ruminococcus flavefaciens]MCM1554135.1 ExeM/NucH family extracellular endonuclease [Bacteroides sp.]